MADADPIPLHQWTHDVGKVLIVKCVAKGGFGHNGFVWPKSGATICPRASADRDKAEKKLGTDEDCKSGGLFGWPWAIGIGGGKETEYAGDWIVFAANPEDVVDLGDKSKSVGEVEVVYYGDSLGAIMYTHAGRMAYTIHASRGSASNSGYRGSASNSGYSGSASNSGYRGSASNSGDSGSASNSGSSGSASNSGYRGSASNSGYRGSASNSGYSGSASNSGYSGSASNSGDSGSASNSGSSGSASNSGDRGSASNSGYSGSASNSGDSGSASNSGDRGSASNSGDRGVAVITGEYSTIEVSAASLGAITSQRWQWIVRPGAVVACRWRDSERTWRQKLLVADELGFSDGQVVKFQDGEQVARWSCS